MRLLLFTLLTIGLASCDKKSAGIDRESALKWSQSSAVTLRKSAATWAVQKPDNTWIAISTARCKETETGLLYDDGEILRSGYYVYPGAKEVSTFEDALALASKIQGATYKLEVTE